MVGHGEKLSRYKESAIASLISCPTVKQAAKKAGVAEKTLHRWLKEDEFITAYVKARGEIVSYAVCQMQKNMPKAINALAEITDDSNMPASARVSAARTLIDMSLKAIEHEDLQLRIRNVEKILEGKNEF